VPVSGLAGICNKDETGVFAASFGDSSVNLLVWFWIDYPGEPGFMIARHKAVVTIQKALNEADILIPFPIRTLDFGAKGGETLGQVIKDNNLSQYSDKTADNNPD
jgi:small-conductance mechanosensitive channel